MHLETARTEHCAVDELAAVRQSESTRRDKSLALDGHTKIPSLAVPLPVRQQHSESAETPEMCSPRLPLMLESMS